MKGFWRGKGGTCANIHKHSMGWCYREFPFSSKRVFFFQLWDLIKEITKDVGVWYLPENKLMVSPLGFKCIASLQVVSYSNDNISLDLDQIRPSRLVVANLKCSTVIPRGDISFDIALHVNVANRVNRHVLDPALYDFQPMIQN